VANLVANRYFPLIHRWDGRPLNLEAAAR